jgi:hypothetical protein
MDFDQMLQNISNILDILIEDYFRLGEVPLEKAYELSILARPTRSKTTI